MATQDIPSPSAQPCDIRMEKLFPFFANIIQIGHDKRNSLKDYWSREKQYYTPFYSNVMVRDRFLHILIFLHFENNDNPPNRNDPEYERLWKTGKIFDILNNKICELYNSTQHLAIDEVIILFKERVIFHQYILKKNIKGST
jgi:hypothetical protein